jgi:hypothetical protein
MKRNFLISIVLLSILSTVGCTCYSPLGLRNPCISPFGVCAHGSGGVVDYIDGGIDHSGSCGEVISESVCDPCAAPVYQNHIACGGIGCQNGAPCANCLVQLANGVRLVGEAALTAAATPFLVVGNVLCTAGRGYETFGSCGCSNEIYLGDNCYQTHDFIDPCSPCGTTKTTCQNCSGHIQDGIQFENIPAQSQTTAKKISNQKIIITNPKQQIVKQPAFTTQKGNIKQAAYIINPK